MSNLEKVSFTGKEIIDFYADRKNFYSSELDKLVKLDEAGKLDDQQRKIAENYIFSISYLDVLSWWVEQECNRRFNEKWKNFGGIRSCNYFVPCAAV